MIRKPIGLTATMILLHGIFHTGIFGQFVEPPSGGRPQKVEHILSRPGEITFFEGAVIVGKVEKPQVMIVFPKEKAKMDSISFDRSFRPEMLEPLEIRATKSLRGD